MENADRYELLSLDPKHQGPIPGAEYFHGYRVIGRTVISDRSTQKKLNDALNQGARESSNIAAACFNPRHGIRAVRGTKTLDLVICFECLYVEVFEGEQSLEGFHTSSSPKPAFDEVLRAAGITLSTN